MSFAQDLQTLFQQHLSIAHTGVLTSTQNVLPQSPSITIKRPWLEPPEGYSSFDSQQGGALPIVGGLLTLVMLTVDPGWDGVINFLSCNFVGGGFQDFSGSIVWSLYRNSSPIRNYNNITAQKGTVQQQRQISPIRIYSGDVITFQITHPNNVALNGNVVCSITGYTYPNRG
jgi:hypothetical protein